MRGKQKSTLAAAIVGIAIAAGCMTEHQEIDETLPPYASISDAGRDPASAPTPTPSASDSGGVMDSIGNAIAYTFHLFFW
ncbi:MAG: hypothetical protein WBQ86_07020 [Candidatus Binatus sp.]